MAGTKKTATQPTAEDVDKVVRDALLKLATTDTPLKLSGKETKTTYPPLLPSAAGVNKQAIERLQDPKKPLIADDTVNKKACVRLTPAGFQKVMPELPEDKIGDAAKQFAGELSLAERIEFLNEIISRTPLAAAELVPLVETATAELKEAEDRKVEAARKRDEAMAASLKAVDRWKELVLEQRKILVESLKRQLEAVGVDSGTVGPTPGPSVGGEKPPLPRPVTPEDHDFRRQAARRMVSAWLDTWEMNKPEARPFLETAIWNMSGMRQIGEEGESVTFSGALHEGPQGVFPGDQVLIVRPGWLLEKNESEYVVAKAQVEK